MGTFTSTTAQRSTAWGSQHKEAATSLGVRWACSVQSADNTNSSSYVIGYSTNNGATWTTNSFENPSGQSGNYTPDSDLIADANNRLHHVITDVATGWTYYRWASLDSTHTVPTWSAWTRLDNATAHSAPALAVHPDPTVSGAVYVHVVASYVTFSSTNFMRYRRGYLTAAGSLTWDSGFTTIGGSYDAQIDVFPSIEFRHTGDGKTVAGGQPDLFVSWTAGRAGTGYGVRFRKATYSTPGGTGTWTFGSEVSVDTTHYVAGNVYTSRTDSNTWISSFWDGTRVVIAGLMTTGSALDLLLHDINPDTSAVTQRTLGAQGAGNAFDLGWGTATPDTAGNVFLFGTESSSGSGSRVLGYRKWTRTGATLAARVALASAGGPTPWVSVSRGGPNSRIGWLSTQGSANPFTVTTGQVVLNYPPNAAGQPTPNATTLDRTQAQTFTYTFSDPDAGDTPSKTDWRWRTSPATGSPGTWQTTTVTGAATTITYPANTFPTGRLEFQALPYDSQGVVAPAWSDSAFNTAADALTAPTFSAPAAGSTIASASVTATIVADTLDAHQWRVMGDTAGSANSTVVNAGATIEDATSRQFTATGLANGQTVHLQDRRRRDGLWSPWADNGAQAVSYTAPPAATMTLTPQPSTAKLTVGWTIPAPTGGQPAVTGVDVYVDDATAEGSHRKPGAVNLPAASTSWVHDTPVLGREYGAGTGRVRVVVKGANGTTATTSS